MCLTPERYDFFTFLSALTGLYRLQLYVSKSSSDWIKSESLFRLFIVHFVH